MNIFLSCISGIILAYLWEYICIHLIKKTSFIIRGFRFHHSIYGLIFIASGIVFRNATILGIGLGIIVQHTITDGFRFVSKER